MVRLLVLVAVVVVAYVADAGDDWLRVPDRLRNSPPIAHVASSGFCKSAPPWSNNDSVPWKTCVPFDAARESLLIERCLLPEILGMALPSRANSKSRVTDMER